MIRKKTAMKLAALLCLLLTKPALADIVSATKAYFDGDYTVALAEFKALAQLGDGRSQKNLGVMYYQGKGVDIDKIEAFAWFVLASENKHENAKELAANVYSMLDEAQRESAKTKAQAYLVEYGQKALQASLYPELMKEDDKIEDDENQNTVSQPEILKTAPVKYPYAALSAGTLGSVLVEFDVAADGTVRNPEVIQSIPKNIFDEEALKSVRRFTYAPAMENGNPVYYRGMRNKITFAIALDDKKRKRAYKPIEKKLDKLSKLAAQGDPAAQYAYALTINNIPGVDSDTKQVTELMSKSATQGIKEAQLVLGANLMYGRGCKLDTQKGINWLTLSAKQGHTPAEYILGRELLENPELKSNQQKAIFWLEKAAAKKHINAMRKLAQLLLNQENVNAGDSKKALVLLQDVSKELKEDPEVYYLLSLAYQQQNMTKKATKYLKKSIKMAEKLNWDVSEWIETLAELKAIGNV